MIVTTETISGIEERSRRHFFFVLSIVLCTPLNSCWELKLDGNSSGHRPATTLPSLRVGIPEMALHDGVM